MKKCCFILLLAALSLTAQGAPFNRQVLALYNSKVGDMTEPNLTDSHKMLEMPLNRLGLVVHYHDIQQQPLPDPRSYRGIIQWNYADQKPDPTAYLHWLQLAISNQVRLVLINGFGAGYNEQGVQTPASLIAQTLHLFGLQLDNDIEQTGNPFVMARDYPHPKRFHWETTMPPQTPYYMPYRTVTNDWDVWCSITRTDIPDSTALSMGTSPRGGFIANAEDIYRTVESPIYQRSWDLNIMQFLEAALNCTGMIRPDVTTVNGCRAAYSHVDGDGMVNLSQDIGTPRISAKILYDEVLQVYPVPITIGTIVGRVDINTLGTAEAMETAREIYALPNIQGGTHGYAHMFSWYEEIPGLIWDGYTFSPRFETIDAINFMNEHVMPVGKTNDVLQWTGDCIPQEAAIAACDDAGFLNINGGDSRYDATFRSRSCISSLTRQIGDRTQVYASAQNENLYTDLWTKNLGGYRQVIDTFENSESPQRLLPVNVYYHIYSAERQAALDALKEVYDWTLRQPLCWITTAEYIRMVHGFMRAEIGTESNRFTVGAYQPCSTVRLDDCTRQVDLATAKNIWGYTHTNGSLYVTLGAGDSASFALSDAKPEQLYLDQSTFLLRGVEAAAQQHWLAEARLFAPGFIQLGGARPNTVYRCNQQLITAGSEGLLRMALPAGTGQWVQVSCRLTGGNTL